MPPRSHSLSTTRTTTTTRTKRRPSLAWLALVASLVLACVPTTQRQPPSRDVPDAPQLARDAAAILLDLAAYDYAVVGTLNGERARVVSPERYAAVAREAARDIADFSSDVVAASANAAGPVRDRVLALGDALVLIGRDAGSYAGAADTAVLARIVDGVRIGWQRLADLAGSLPPDGALQRTMMRGRSFEVTARNERVHVLAVGPFASVAEADAAAAKMGAVQTVTRTPPFVVRVGTYTDRAVADAAAAALVPKGFTTSSVTEEQRQVFARFGAVPDVELWREPVRVFDVYGGSRRVAASPDGSWIASGADDGTVAIFSSDGILRSLPKFSAGVAHLLFSDDGRWLFAGGVTLATLLVPSGQAFGTAVRLPSPATQVVFVPTARAFAATSKGPTGLPGGGGGAVAARAPDGTVLADPFPLTTPAAGAVLAATDLGELIIATPAVGGRSTDIEILRVGAERAPRGMVQVPGTVRTIAVDRRATRAAVITEQQVYRFEPRSLDPTSTLVTVGAAVRDVAYGLDGTLYLLEATRLVALDPTSGAQRWTTPLVDGRRLVIAKRAIVLDGSDRLLAIDDRGAVEELGTTGTLQDVSATPDGRRVIALSESGRALLFTLP